MVSGSMIPLSHRQISTGGDGIWRYAGLIWGPRENLGTNWKLKKEQTSRIGGVCRLFNFFNGLNLLCLGLYMGPIE